MAREKIPAETRFWKYVQMASGNGCWTWTGYRMPKGYGHFQVGVGESRLAHRYAYRLLVGPIPKGMGVLHRCDTPSCVRPDHLFLGSQLDNMADAVAKGRQARGDRLRISGKRTAKKLTAADTIAIRRVMQNAPRQMQRNLQFLRPGHVARNLAEQYGVSVVRIYQIGRSDGDIRPQSLHPGA